MNYLLREVPDDVWRQAKAVAALRGTTVRELIIAGLRALSAAREPSLDAAGAEEVPRAKGRASAQRRKGAPDVGRP